MFCVTSRSLASAEALTTRISAEHPVATIAAAAIDQEAPGLVDQLRQLAPGIVVHTAGPYQRQDYRVARACIAAGCHYVDLADAREFVANFAALDPEARRAGVILVSGASTLPGISSAVVDEYRSDFLQIEDVETSIAPAHQTPRGIGTVQAGLSYCGEAFETWSEGQWRTVHGSRRSSDGRSGGALPEPAMCRTSPCFRISYQG